MRLTSQHTSRRRIVPRSCVPLGVSLPEPHPAVSLLASQLMGQNVAAFERLLDSKEQQLAHLNSRYAYLVHIPHISRTYLTHLNSRHAPPLMRGGREVLPHRHCSPRALHVHRTGTWAASNTACSKPYPPSRRTTPSTGELCLKSCSGLWGATSVCKQVCWGYHIM